VSVRQESQGSGSTGQTVTIGSAIPAGNNNIGDVDVASVPAPLSTTGGGVESTALRVTVASDSTGVLSVDDNGGSLTVDGGVTVVGTVADDATTPGAPAMIGGKAVETDNTDPTSVSAEDDVAIARTDRNRRLLVNLRHPNGFRGNENNATAQTDNPIVAAPGNNLSLYITDLIISNGATAGTVLIEEDTGSTKAVLLGPYYLAANGGLCKKFLTPVRVTANKDIGYTSVTVTTHTVTVIGYTAP
jgi:hypothetical protein